MTMLLCSNVAEALYSSFSVLQRSCLRLGRCSEGRYAVRQIYIYKSDMHVNTLAQCKVPAVAPQPRSKKLRWYGHVSAGKLTTE